MPEQSQSRINDAHRRLAAIIESSDDAIVSKDLDGVVQSWNKSAERIFGYPASEMIGRSIRILIPPDRQQEEELILGNVRDGKPIKHYESIRLRKDGTPINVSLTVSPIQDEEGHVIGASKIARDITEAKRMQVALQNSIEQKDQFLATLAHELRNPLAPLRNGIELLPPECDDGLKAMMQRQVEHLIRLVDDLMDLNRVTMGKIELRMEVIPVDEIVRAAVETVSHHVAQKKQHLEVAFMGTSVVRGDRARLIQILVNLLVNASKFTQPSGNIALNVEETAEGVEITVKDNGNGFAPGTIDTAFEMFSQVVPKSQGQNTGLGIGLHVVRKLVQLHGGSIDGTSEGLGKGSEFKVRIPLNISNTAPELHSHRSEVEQWAVPQKKILIAEDNPDVAFALSALLIRDGHEVLLAHTGIDAVKLARDHRPEFIIMDLGMPGINGYEACRQIRGTDWGQQMIIVALSGWGQPEDIRRSMDSGFDEHFVKPVSRSVLRSILAKPRPSPRT